MSKLSLMQRRDWRTIGIAGALVLAVGLGLMTANAVSSQPQGERPLTLVSPRSLVGASPDEIGQYVLAVAHRDRLIRPGGKAEVRFARLIAQHERERYGFGWSPPENDPPHLAVVILKGDVTMYGLPGHSMTGPLSHLALLLDADTGGWFAVAGSPRGAAFREILGDPSLPTTDLYPWETPYVGPTLSPEVLERARQGPPGAPPGFGNPRGARPTTAPR